MTLKIPDDALSRLRAHAKSARDALGVGDRATAEREFLAAWACIPEPYAQYDESQMASRAMVEFYRDGGKYGDARRWLGIARELYADAPSIVSIDFLGGTVEYDAGNVDTAFEIFDTIFRKYKTRPFEGQPKKYLEFYRRRSAKT